MEHFYNQLEGWMSETHAEFFKEIISNISDNSTWVEIGSFKGKSISFVTVEALRQDKKISFYAVDTWLGSEEHQQNGVAEDIDVVNKSLFEKFKSNTNSIKNLFISIRKASVDASKDFENNSIDVLYIDGAHDYQSVLDDICCWFPKLKKKSLLILDDINRPGVSTAVSFFLQDKNFVLQKKGKYIGYINLS